MKYACASSWNMGQRMILPGQLRMRQGSSIKLSPIRGGPLWPMRGRDCDKENQGEASPGQVSSGKHLPNLSNCDPRQPGSDLDFSPRPGQSAWVSKSYGRLQQGKLSPFVSPVQGLGTIIISRLACHWDATREQEVSHFNSNTIMASGKITWEFIGIPGTLCRQVCTYTSVLRKHIAVWWWWACERLNN